MVSKFVVWASGYPNPYKDPNDEAIALQAHRWTPASVDFQAAAQLSGTPLDAREFDGFLEQIAKQKVGSINQLGINGHASEYGVSLSGYFKEEDDGFKTYLWRSSTITIDLLESRKADTQKVQDRFASGAFITLFCCSVGIKQEYLVAWREAFGVECRGFKMPLWACAKPVVAKKIPVFGGEAYVTHYTITERGRHAYKPLLPPKHKPCDFRTLSLWDLKTDSSSRS